MARFRDSAFYQVYLWLTSVKLTVVLLAIILIALIVGTVFEANRGTAAAQFLFYNSRWFDAILIFFAINLTCCTIRRFKRRLSQIGFITTHIGVMVILIGGLMSRNMKTEGQLIVPEGESRSFILLSDNVLTVSTLMNGGRVTREYDTHYDKLGGRTEVKDTFRVPEGNIELVVDRFYPDFRAEDMLVDTAPEPSPALEFLVHGFGGEQTAAIFADSRLSRQPGVAPITMSFVEAPDDATLEQELGPQGPATSRNLGQVEVELTTGARLVIPVDGGIGRSYAPSGSSAQVTIEAFYPHFFFTGQEYSSRSPAMANPAVVVDVVDPGGVHERHLLFSDKPDMNVNHRDGGELTRALTYQREGGVSEIAGEVKFVHGPDGAIHFVARGAGGKDGAVRRGTIAIESEAGYPETGSTFKLARVLDNARFEQRVWNAGREARNPALHVTLRSGDEERSLWVGVGASREIMLGDIPVVLDYGAKQHDLGFSVQLKDFREINYPGISMAQSFESDVVVTAPEKTFSRMISMNNPLKFHGYKLFQSSFQRGARETSIFSVARDPGVPVVYAGSLILVVGLILIFFVKPYLIRTGTQRRVVPPGEGAAGVEEGTSLHTVASPGLGGSQANVN